MHKKIRNLETLVSQAKRIKNKRLEDCDVIEIATLISHGAEKISLNEKADKGYEHVVSYKGYIFYSKTTHRSETLSSLYSKMSSE